MQRCSLCGFKKCFYPLSLVTFTLFLFSSCRISKPTAYFRTLGKDTSINQFVDKNIESKIVKNDILSISVSSLNKLEDELYNVASLSSGSSSGSPSGGATSSVSTSHGQGYTVDLDGNIQIHNLGKIHAEGMTLRELKDSLEIDLLPYLRDPIVTAGFLNRHITVLGEVAKPQVVDLQGEKISLLDVLATTGDVTSNALKNDILVIRETPKGKIFKHVNLENASLYKDSSKWYYLQSGDIVYVEPDLKKLIRQERHLQLQQNAAILVAIVSLIVVLIEVTR